MTSPMLEKATAAAREATYEQAGGCAVSELDVHDFAAIVRAVLLAIREPDDGMQKAGDLPGWDDTVTIDLSGQVWTAMIDTILSEGETK